MDRRNFLVSSAAALGAASQVFGTPSDTVRVACIGIGGRSTAHIGGYSKLPNVEIAAICDPDDSHIAKGLAQIDRLGKPKPQTYSDIRKLLEDKIHRRDFHLYAQSLARFDDHLGLPGRQGCVRRKALHAQYF